MSSPITIIKKLALVTQLAAYKDVIPGYRIRPLSDEDMKAKVSKDVRRLRAYEQSLVSNYQAYVKELSKLTKGGRSEQASQDSKSLASVAMSCACRLLV